MIKNRNVSSLGMYALIFTSKMRLCNVCIDSFLLLLKLFICDLNRHQSFPSSFNILSSIIFGINAHNSLNLHKVPKSEFADSIFLTFLSFVSFAFQKFCLLCAKMLEIIIKALSIINSLFETCLIGLKCFSFLS